MSDSLDNTLVLSHHKLTANQWPLLVYRTHHRISIQRRAPTIIQLRHTSPAPLIGLNKAIWHTGIGNKEHLQTTTAGFTACTSHLRVWQVGNIDGVIF